MPSVKVKCAGCGDSFVAKTARAKWCGETCRKRALRAKPKSTPAARKAAASSPRRQVKSGFEKATEAELRKLGKLTTMLGQQALLLAKRMGRDDEGMSALATLSREHSRIMEQLGATVPPPDEVTQARQAREAKRRAAGLS